MNIIRASCKIARWRYQSYGLGGVRVHAVLPMPTNHSIGFLDIIYSRTFFVGTLHVDESGISLCTTQYGPTHSWIGGSSL